MNLKTWNILGVAIIFILAAFWHFIYNLLPNNFIGAISPVNESPWEHVKLFFVPAILFYILQYFVAGRYYPNYIFSYSIALLIMPVFMLLFYYLYSSVIDETFIFDIINSILTIALGLFVGYKLTISKLNLATPVHHPAAVLIVFTMLAVYVVFTFMPPECNLFFDKAKAKYGI